MTHRTKKKNEVAEIIEKSGNSFHSRVVNLLRKEGWTVLVSPYYSDNFTDKPREIDIIAEKKFNIDIFGSGWIGTLDVRLFVECKYINGKTVFWFDTKDKEKATERIMEDTGMEHPHHNINIEKLHYFQDVPVAKLFASEKSRGEEHEIWSKAINQNLNALVYYRNKNDLIPPDKNLMQKVLRRVSFPIIACSSFENLYRTDMANESGESEQITKPFQLEVNYAYVNRARVGLNEYFLIDVVSIELLSEFLATLGKTDIQAIKEKIAWDERMSKK